MTADAPRAEMPKGLLVLAGGLMLFTIAIAGSARLSGNNHVVLPPTTAVASRDLLFRDLPNGGVDVKDAATDEHVYTVEPTTGGFLRGVLRGLVRDHRKVDKSMGYAFRLTRWADGRLSIADPTTDETFELEAFGATNEAAFALLLEHPTKVGSLTGTETR